MFYVELLRARNTILISAGIVILMAAIALAILALWPDHLRVTSHDEQAAFSTIGWIAALITAIVASFLSCSLASENCHHLEIAWTKPISRDKYAAGLFVVDLASLMLIFLAVAGIAYGVVSAYVGGPVHVTLDASNAWRAARFALFPIAWFGMGQALTSGISGAVAGAVTGLSWPVAELLSILATRPFSSTWHTIFSVINLVNPIAYFPFWEFDDSTGSALREYFGYGLTTDTLALALLAVLGVAFALARWRRLEA
jgi:hypothetical protein